MACVDEEPDFSKTFIDRGIFSETFLNKLVYWLSISTFRDRIIDGLRKVDLSLEEREKCDKVIHDIDSMILSITNNETILNLELFLLCLTAFEGIMIAWIDAIISNKNIYSLKGCQKLLIASYEIRLEIFHVDMDIANYVKNLGIISEKLFVDNINESKEDLKSINTAIAICLVLDKYT